MVSNSKKKHATMDRMTILDVILIAQVLCLDLIVLKVSRMGQHFVKKFVEMGWLLAKNSVMTESLMTIKDVK